MPPNWESSSATFFNVSVFSRWCSFPLQKTFYIFLRPNQFLHLVPCLAVVRVICHQFSGNIRKLLADTLSADAIGGGEHFRNRLFQVVVKLPHLWVTELRRTPVSDTSKT